jgi:pyrroloquinoline quinone biosynthesis protein B
MPVRVVVLGSAAGGGYPQWNCRCSVCRLFWDGDQRVRRKTQSSIAVSSNGQDWVLLNCSPDIREQIGRTPVLQPKSLRGSPIRAVIVTNGDIDHIGGLLSLREGTPFRLYGTKAVLGTIKENPVFAVLDGAGVEKSAFALNQTFSPLPGLMVEAFTVPGKVPLYMEGKTPDTELQSEYTVGLEIKDETGHRLHYIPGCSKLTPELRQRVEGSDLIFFDGTLWCDDEMIAEGLSQKTGRRMGHMPMSGKDSSLEAFTKIGARRKVYIHINNSNPILVRGTPEEAAVRAAGWDIAEDGMEIEL